MRDSAHITFSYPRLPPKFHSATLTASLATPTILVSASYPMLVVLSVGSTQFSGLVHFALQETFFSALAEAGYTHLHAQTGHSSLPSGIKLGETVSNKLSVFVERFNDDLDALLGTADLVISHAGASLLLICIQHELQHRGNSIFKAQERSLLSSTVLLSTYHTLSQDSSFSLPTPL